MNRARILVKLLCRGNAPLNEMRPFSWARLRRTIENVLVAVAIVLILRILEKR